MEFFLLPRKATDMTRILKLKILWIFALMVLGNIQIVSAQAWLTDRSFLSGRNPAPPAPKIESIPTPPGLQEPPPPLIPENVPTVFDPPTTSQMPTENLVSSGMSWYKPWTWVPWDGWVNSAELGLNGSDGNSQSFSFQSGARFKRKTETNLIDLRITQNRTTSDGVERQNNALMYLDLERFFGDSPWTAFLKNGVEYDEFRAFDLRYNINSGVGYRFFNTPDLSLKGRFGAGTSREFGGPDNRWVPEALFGADYEHQVNKRNKVIAKIDYFPEWTDFSNYRLNSDLAWEILLNETGNMSLKLGALDRYDSTPNGRKANDINYSALLLYKF